jgi:hypothetical protein
METRSKLIDEILNETKKKLINEICNPKSPEYLKLLKELILQVKFTEIINNRE